MKFIKLIAFAFIQAACASNNIDDIAATSGNAEVVLRQLANETETTTASTVAAESTEVAVTTTAAPEVDPATADGFAPLDGDFSMVSSLTIGGGEVKTTIQPSAVPFVSTYPADVDFVTPIADGESLTIKFDEEAVKEIRAKLRIGLPPDQVKSISLGSSLDVEILNGFTSVEKLEVAPITKVQADLSSNTNPDLQVLVPTLAEANVIADVVGYVRVGNSGGVNIEAETVSEILVENSALLTVDGNVGSGIVTSSSTLSVSGDIKGQIDVSSASQLSANTISGSVVLSWSSSATASSCKNVEVLKHSSSTCSRVTNGGSIGSSTTIATSAVMMSATLLVL